MSTNNKGDHNVSVNEDNNPFASSIKKERVHGAQISRTSTGSFIGGANPFNKKVPEIEKQSSTEHK